MNEPELQFTWRDERNGYYGSTLKLEAEVAQQETLGLAPPRSGHLYKPATSQARSEQDLPSNARRAVEQLRSTNKRAFGLGMAIQQLAVAGRSGINHRVFVMLTGLRSLKREDLRTGTLITCFDPSYEAAPGAKRVLKREACLSCPGVWVEVERWDKITARWWQDGKLITRILTGSDAHVFQHETDHTNGLVCQELALGQGRNLYFVPPEVIGVFLDVSNLDEWPFPLATRCWQDLKAGRFSFAKKV